MTFLNDVPAAARSVGSNTESPRIAQLVGALETKSYVFSSKPKAFVAASVPIFQPR